jgi:hypothetical protein
MKKPLALAFAALVLSAGAALAAPLAASAAQAASQPQSAAAASGYGSQNRYAWLDDQDGVHLMPLYSVSRNEAAAPLLCGTCVLVNRTGDGER